MAAPAALPRLPATAQVAGAASAPARGAATRLSGEVAVAQLAETYAQRVLTADWAAAVLSSGGVGAPRLPTSSDGEFRAALRDGTLLCALVNTLRPGSVAKVRGAGRRRRLLFGQGRTHGLTHLSTSRWRARRRRR